MLDKFKSGGLAINCKTYEEWCSLINITYHNFKDMRNVTQEGWNEFYYDYHEKTCLCAQTYVGYGDRIYYRAHDITIITFEEFMSGFSGISMPSKSDLIDFLTGE